MPSRADVQAAVDQLSSALGLSVLVEDRARQLPVWWNTQGEVDRVRQATILDRHVDPSVAAVIRTLPRGKVASGLQYKPRQDLGRTRE